jgi:deferrochelatase/peroxidase EfeB
MNARRVDYDDTQGLVRFGYGGLTEACYVLARVRNAAAARAWLRAAPVTNAVALDQAPPTALQIAFTAPGLEALGVPRAVIDAFSHEFVSGMTEPSRSRRLGDIGVDAPSRWIWGAPAGTPHLVAMFFARPGQLDGFMKRLMAAGWYDAFEKEQRLPTGDLDQREPFGFADGISQPEIDWDQTRDPVAARIEYGNVVALGEFLLGYRNEYGKYTDRPLLDAGEASAGLPAAEDAPDKRDVGRNGTYVVMRQLRQDVRGFWDFLLAQVQGDLAKAETLAAAMVGRMRNGDPLVPTRARRVEGSERKAEAVGRNEFDFDDDPSGVRCPIGAHIRRANPRNADFVGRPTGLARLIAMLGFGQRGFRDDLTSSVRFHRILRRGREYGEQFSPADALKPAPPDDRERGLHFICLNANISRQFEFLQNAWTMNAKFATLSGENDPLVGNREAVAAGAVDGRFTIPRDGRVRESVSGLPQFVTTRGGAYFFLPGLRALRYFAADGRR